MFSHHEDEEPKPPSVPDVTKPKFWSHRGLLGSFDPYLFTYRSYGSIEKLTGHTPKHGSTWKPEEPQQEAPSGSQLSMTSFWMFWMRQVCEEAVRKQKITSGKNAPL